MCEVVCQYKEKCTSHPQWCYSCKNNTGKKNYYQPDYHPFVWTYPWYGFGTVTSGGGDSYYIPSTPSTSI